MREQQARSPDKEPPNAHQARTDNWYLLGYNKCPARYKVTDGHGGAVFIGRKLEEMDPETLASIQDKIGPGEAAFWVPDDLL